MSKQLRLDVAQLTDVGRKRPHNEDNMAHVIPKDEGVMAHKGALFIVADGMGGHAAGEVASEIAVYTVTNTYYQDDSEDVAVSLMNAIKRANALIQQRAAENMQRTGMGTTCVAAVLRGSMAYIANVGDSRAYLVRDGQVKQISQDHSWVEEQVRAGLLTRDQARSHAQRNVITRCLGTQAEVEVDVFSEQLQEGDSLILCTDGLSGAILEDDLRAIIDQYVPRESVYHLVERANENGGQDNITAIVVRVQELGVEPPDTLHPVRVGGREANEDTAVMAQLPGPLFALPVRVEDGRSPSVPLRNASGPLFAPGTLSTPQAAITPKPRKRNRLLYPSLALFILLVVALFGGGAYYFLHSTNDISGKLDRADDLIKSANNQLTSNPAGSLQQLALAQRELLNAQSPLLLGEQSSRFASLQSSFTRSVNEAVTSYNRHALISTLPCNITNSVPVNTAGANVTPESIVTIQDEKQKQNVFSYVLADDHNLYQLDAQQHTLSSRHNFANNAQALTITNNAQHVFALTIPATQGTSPTTYSLTMLSLDQAPALKEDSITISGSMTKDGWAPKMMTASNSDLYVLLTSKTTPNQAKILDYNTEKWHDEPQSFSISSPEPVSIVPFPNKQLFLLTSDGAVKSLQLGSSMSNPSNPLPQPVVVQSPITPPLTLDTQNATWSTPLAVTPTAQPVAISPQTVPLTILNVPGAVGLAANTMNNVSHLYVVDNAHHRVLDFNPVPTSASTPSSTTPTPAPTPTQGDAGGKVVNIPSGSVMMQLNQQYVSASVLPSVKSAIVDPASTQLDLLTLDGKTPRQVFINVARICLASP